VSVRVVEEVTGRVRDIIRRVRERIPGGSMAGQIQVGRGQLIETARSKLRELTSRVEALRPRVVPIVKEYRLGEKIMKAGLMGQSEHISIESGEAADKSRLFDDISIVI